jgi:subtilisin-like proprotein convertase family protein
MDYEREQYFTVPEAFELLTSLRPPNGTWRRWVLTGVRSPNGRVKLETVKFGGRVMITLDKAREFLTATNSRSDQTIKQVMQMDTAAKAEAYLDGELAD